MNYILFELLNAVSFKCVHPDIIKIEKLIDDNIGQKITLGMVADQVHLSKEYVAYLFKKNVGMTVIDYVNERKMLLAKDMIGTQDRALREIAAELGFENYGYFSRLFKKHFNTSPQDFKLNK